MVVASVVRILVTAGLPMSKIIGQPINRLVVETEFINNFIVIAKIWSNSNNNLHLSAEFWQYYIVSQPFMLLRCVINPVLYNFASTNFKEALISIRQNLKLKLVVSTKTKTAVSIPIKQDCS